MFRHVLRNALLPVTTMAGLHLGHLLGGGVVVETVFGWPGLGRLMIEAVQAREYNVLLGILFMSSFVVILANILIDLVARLARSHGSRWTECHDRYAPSYRAPLAPVGLLALFSNWRRCAGGTLPVRRGPAGQRGSTSALARAGGAISFGYRRTGTGCCGRDRSRCSCVTRPPDLRLG